jgi:hypothetical protein
MSLSLLNINPEVSCDARSHHDGEPYDSQGNNNNRTPNPMTEKSVMFALMCRVRPTKHVNDMSEKFVNKIWYGQEEYQKFRADRKHTKKQAKSGNLGPQLCIRGLEKIIFPHRSAICRRQREIAWDVVLEEQALQLEKGECSPESIAIVYGTCCSQSLRDAQIQGLRDQEVAQLKEWQCLDEPAPCEGRSNNAA